MLKRLDETSKKLASWKQTAAVATTLFNLIDGSVADYFPDKAPKDLDVTKTLGMLEKTTSDISNNLR